MNKRILARVRANNFVTKTQLLGFIFIFGAVLVLILTLFYSSSKSQETLVFSDKTMLDEIWRTYKINYIEAGTNRTLDKQKNNITTSEAESYTLLRSVWQDDKDTYDKSLKWTQDNLKRSTDNLYSWLFGEKSSGKYGILVDQGGNNTATDADSDIALSLVLAYSRWQDPSYLKIATPLIKDIWKNEVVLANGKPIVVADNLEKISTADSVIVNPSYFAPYSYKIFEQLDPSDDWTGLTDNMYSILSLNCTNILDKNTSAGLPSDWITISKKTGEISPSTYASQTTNFGYDAMRVSWRVAVDWLWNNDERAKSLLGKMSFLQSQYTSSKTIYSTYSHDGKIIYSQEAPSMYGTSIGYFLVLNPSDAKDIYQNKLVDLFDANSRMWKNTLGYYDDNWAWFGMALYNDQIVNLTSNVTLTPDKQ